MLEKPELKDDSIINCLQEAYGLRVSRIEFLPLGADRDTAVYRVTTQDGIDYFLKLRCGAFNPAGVTVPKFLSDRGMKQVIPPLTTRIGALWADLTPYKVILYPYVEGHNAYEKKLSHQHWIDFGAALKKLHTLTMPATISCHIRKEDFSPRWREEAIKVLTRIEQETFDDPLAVELSAFLKSKSEEIIKLVNRAGRLAQELQDLPPEFVLCHSDIHGWNLLIDKNDALYLVDWDTLIYAPKERDLMFIGCGLGNSGYTPQEEGDLFYRGYGRIKVNRSAIAYYRYERIIEDIAAFCDQIFSSDGSGEDRKQSLEYLKSNFLQGNTIERAYLSDRTSLSH